MKEGQTEGKEERRREERLEGDFRTEIDEQDTEGDFTEEEG